jgi:hypothetical protein
VIAAIDLHELAKTRQSSACRCVPRARGRTRANALRRLRTDSGLREASRISYQDNVSVETLRKWMTAAGLWKPRVERRRRPQQPRHRRLGRPRRLDAKAASPLSLVRAPEPAQLSVIDNICAAARTRGPTPWCSDQSLHVRLQTRTFLCGRNRTFLNCPTHEYFAEDLLCKLEVAFSR